MFIIFYIEWQYCYKKALSAENTIAGVERNIATKKLILNTRNWKPPLLIFILEVNIKAPEENPNDRNPKKPNCALIKIL